MTSIVGKQSLGNLGYLQAGWPGKNASTAGQASPGAPTKAHILNTGDLAYLDAPVVRAPEEVGAVLEPVPASIRRLALQRPQPALSRQRRGSGVGPRPRSSRWASWLSFRAHQGSALNPSYLAGLLRSTYGQQLVEPFMHTSTSTTTINLKKLEHLQVPLPAREEQDRLARMFHALEEVRRAQEAMEQQRLAYVDAMIRWTVKA